MFFSLSILGIVFGVRVNRARQERDAVDRIRAAGGEVHYFDDDSSDARYCSAWCREVLGRRYPFYIDVDGKQITDDFVKTTILPLGSLAALSCRNVALTDGAVRSLASLRKLKSLTCIREPSNKHLVDALASPGVIDFDKMPFDDLIDYLSDLYSVSFKVSEEIKRAGITLPDSIDFHLRDMSFAEILELLLAEHGLGYVIANGQIVITSRAAANSDRRNSLILELQRSMPQLYQLDVD